MLVVASILPLAELAEAEVERSKVVFAESPTVEEYVRNYFVDIPIMAEVAACESHFRHLDKRGRVLRGEINWYDVGVMQINELYHLLQAKELGYNLYSLEGNLAYARDLYEREGTQPWNSSSACWSKYQHLAQS